MPFALLLLGVLLAIRGGQAYATNVRLYQIPLPLTLFGRSTAHQHAHPDSVGQSWRRWRTDIETELLRFGDARPIDLRAVPQLFRHYALQQYHDQFGKRQALELNRDQLRLTAFDQVQRWRRAWSNAAEQLAGKRNDPLHTQLDVCLLYTSPSPRDGLLSRMPSSA